MKYSFERKLRNKTRGLIILMGLLSITTVTSIGIYHMWQDNNVKPEISGRETIKSDQVLDENTGSNEVPAQKIEEFSPETNNSNSENVKNFEGRRVVPGEIIRLETINFDENKSVITEDSFEELNRLAEFLKKNPYVKIEVHGHTDKTKNENFSLELSLKRAESVRKFLITKGVKNKIDVKGYGFDQPLKNTEGVYPTNRRVEVRIIGI